MPEFIVVTSQNIEKFFDDNVITYDYVGPAIYKHFGLRLVNWVSLKHDTKMLDIATGTGAVLLPAARLLGPNGRVTGIDLSGGLLRELEASAHAEGLTNVEFRKMDAEHLEFPDQTFDCVTCAFSLYFFPNMEAALHEMYRVCKSGGCLGLTVFNRTPPPFDPIFPIMLQELSTYQGKVYIPPHGMSFSSEEMENLLRQYGFHSIKTQSETKDFLYSSEVEVCAFPPLNLALLDSDEGTLAQFKDEFLTKLRPLFQPDGLHVSVTAVYAIGQR